MANEDKYGKAIGIWNLTVGGANLDLKPTVGDSRKFRRLLMNENNKKDKDNLFNQLESFLLELIQRTNPPANDEEKEQQIEYVAFNVNKLMEETLIAFRWATREELDKSKTESVKDLKKLIGEA